MRIGKIIVASMMILIFFGALQLAIAQSAKLEGVWKFTEIQVSGPNARTISAQPGMIIFTKKHYSRMLVMSDKPRPEIPEKNATDAQIVAALGSFAANAGTYEVKGTELTVHPIVALNPSVMRQGNSSTMDFKIEGNTLTLTQKASSATTTTNPRTFKLVRVEE